MKTAYVGLSGGVDSSVAAALLKQQGYDVVGVYMQNWTTEVAGVACPWKADLADAKAVAAVLDIPFKVFDFQDRYRSQVVEYLVSEYRGGRTPNPDIMCNQEIKFNLFLKTALADGADFIATGHYARIVARYALRATRYDLQAGFDRAKDQSYFLYRIPSAALSRIIFPLGELTKLEVRRLAGELGLPTAAKPDSQGICFVGEVGIKDFLRQYVESKPGPVIRISDEAEIGSHEGAVFYTIGQRHGLGIGGGKPYFVVDKDMHHNTVYVTDDPADLTLATDEFAMNDAHWVNAEPASERTYKVRTRYRGSLINCRLEPTEGGYVVKMAHPDRAVTPGQSAVIYKGGKVLGGGIISAPLAISPKIKAISQKDIVNLAS